MTTQKCEDRIGTEWGDRKESISALNDWEIREYPLCFDYVEANTSESMRHTTGIKCLGVVHLMKYATMN